MTNQPDPREALDAIASARQAVPGEMKYPLGYDLIYGAVCGLLVAGQGLPTPWSAVALVISMAALAGLVHWWKQKFGWWVSGYSPKRARWVAFGLGAVLVGLISLSLYGRYVGPDWLWMVSGGIGFVASIAGGRLWMHVWRKELAEGIK